MYEALSYECMGQALLIRVLALQPRDATALTNYALLLQVCEYMSPFAARI